CSSARLSAQSPWPLTIAWLRNLRPMLAAIARAAPPSAAPAIAPVEPQRNALCPVDLEPLDDEELLLERDELERLAVRVAMTHPPFRVLRQSTPCRAPPFRRFVAAISFPVEKAR